MLLLLKIILEGLILNPYFIAVFVVNIIGVLYIRRLNRKYELKKKRYY